MTDIVCDSCNRPDFGEAAEVTKLCMPCRMHWGWKMCHRCNNYGIPPNRAEARASCEVCKTLCPCGIKVATCTQHAPKAAKTERPCRQCQKPNDLTSKSCWWCCTPNPTS